MASSYLEQLKAKLTRHFDFLPESELHYAQITFDLAARSNIRNEAYLLLKSAVMYAFENNELCLVKETNEVNDAWIERLEDALIAAAKVHVVPSDEHMSTALTGILMTPGPIDLKLKRKIMHYRKQQSYWFGLRGWTSFRMILIETDSNTVTASKEAKHSAKFLRTWGNLRLYNAGLQAAASPLPSGGAAFKNGDPGLLQRSAIQ